MYNKGLASIKQGFRFITSFLSQTLESPWYLTSTDIKFFENFYHLRPPNILALSCHINWGASFAIFKARIRPTFQKQRSDSCWILPCRQVQWCVIIPFVPSIRRVWSIMQYILNWLVSHMISKPKVPLDWACWAQSKASLSFCNIRMWPNLEKLYKMVFVIGLVRFLFWAKINQKWL